MKAAALRIARPETVEEALELAGQYGQDAKFIAGGQSLAPALNLRMASASLLIDLAALPSLKGISEEHDRLIVRACTTYTQTQAHPKIRGGLPLVVEGIGHIAHAAIRNVGTVGGSLALADPAAEMPAMAVALGASIKILGREGSRVVSAEKFFKGLCETDLADGELLAEVHWPIAGWEFWRFLEITRRRGDYATAGVILLGRRQPQGGLDVRICAFGVSSRPSLLPKTAGALVEATRSGRPFDEAVADACSELDIDGDTHTPAETKAHLLRVLLARQVTALTEFYRERL
jgi:aerobic carbon-monoxide dehydrogenase medium subunit